MLRKVLRYEFRSHKRLGLPLLFALLGTVLLSFLCGLLLYSPLMSKPFLALIRGAAIFFYVMLNLALGALALVFLFLVVYRYFTSCFTDEGYLTFLLPVKLSTLLFGKLVAAYLVFLLTFLTVMAALLLSLLLPPLLLGYDLSWILDLFPLLFGSLTGNAVASVLLVAETVLLLLCELASLLVVFYTAITVGSAVMRKHKLLGSLLFILLVSSVSRTAVSLLSGLLNLSLFAANESMHPAVAYAISGGVNLLLYAGIAVGGFFLCRRILASHPDLD